MPTMKLSAKASVQVKATRDRFEQARHFSLSAEDQYRAALTEAALELDLPITIVSDATDLVAAEHYIAQQAEMIHNQRGCDSCCSEQKSPSSDT